MEDAFASFRGRVSKDGRESKRCSHPRATASPLSRETPREECAAPQDEVGIHSHARRMG